MIEADNKDDNEISHGIDDYHLPKRKLEDVEQKAEPPKKFLRNHSPLKITIKNVPATVLFDSKSRTFENKLPSLDIKHGNDSHLCSVSKNDPISMNASKNRDVDDDHSKKTDVNDLLQSILSKVKSKSDQANNDNKCVRDTKNLISSLIKPKPYPLIPNKEVDSNECIHDRTIIPGLSLTDFDQPFTVKSRANLSERQHGANRPISQYMQGFKADPQPSNVFSEAVIDGISHHDAVASTSSGDGCRLPRKDMQRTQVCAILVPTCWHELINKIFAIAQLF